MKPAPSRAILLATLLAVMMHLLLFAAIRPISDINLRGMPVPPKTSYLNSSSDKLVMSGKEVRTIRSPVLFSLPSNMGFSRELKQQDVHTRLTFSQDVEPEQFLKVDYVKSQFRGLLAPKELMITASAPAGPDLPIEIYQFEGKRGSAPRVNLTPELKDRLDGGIILPPALNKETPKPWAIHATLSITEEGLVRHVFLDQPLELMKLNQELLQLLYSLHFKPGNRLEGSIEIYSPEAVLTKAVAP